MSCNEGNQRLTQPINLNTNPNISFFTSETYFKITISQFFTSEKPMKS